ncbi:MAG: hypothetical protein V2B19_24755 [Pseudomonadota bacterium]
MERLTVFPNKAMEASGLVSEKFLSMGIHHFIDACRFVQKLSYGYNSNRDDLMILFKENFGSCTTKHAVIATLAAELGLPIGKAIGIYAMTEEIVSGASKILDRYGLPYVPMLHCFLVHGDHRVDLTEGNNNGKNRPIDDFLFTEKVIPNITAKDEYLVYRKALKDHILFRNEMKGIDITRILKAREEALSLLMAKVR